MQALTVAARICSPAIHNGPMASYMHGQKFLNRLGHLLNFWLHMLAIRSARYLAMATGSGYYWRSQTAFRKA
jgi:hypothetical protein